MNILSNLKVGFTVKFNPAFFICENCRIFNFSTRIQPNFGSIRQFQIDTLTSWNTDLLSSEPIFLSLLVLVK